MVNFNDKSNYLNHPLSIENNENWTYNPKILNILLTDKTTNGNIKWATDDYEHFGEGYSEKQEVSTFYMSKEIKKLILPRLQKINRLRSSRRKDKGEVFTPSWICNKQNNLIDNAWFGKQNVFNTPINKTWKTNRGKIKFPQNKTWKEYVKENRLEMACGEAPYLVSRYDAVNGKNIPVKERIGLLDRKLRIVSECI